MTECNSTVADMSDDSLEKAISKCVNRLNELTDEQKSRKSKKISEAREEYERGQQAELIRQLEAIILQLNSSYTQDTQEESTRRSWFFSNG